jgi:glucose-1-phosphate thymidylyltransferase
MRAAVLARGLARRMRLDDDGADLSAAQAEAAGAGRKAMMPVGDDAPGGEARPFLDYVLSSLADAGYREVALVIGPDQHDVRGRYGGGVPVDRLRIAHVVQAEARGTADAVLACETWAAGAPFTVVNADNLYPVEMLRALGQLDGPGLPIFTRERLVDESGIPLERVATFALLEVGPDGRLTGIVEKPGLEAMAAAGPDAPVSMNCWRFDARIFEACRDVDASPRGEYELPMAVGLALSRGVVFRTFAATGAVFDLSRRADVASVARRLAGRRVRL